MARAFVSVASVASVGAVAFVVVAAVACRSKPAPGAPCRAIDQLVCGAPDRALVCEPAASSGDGGNGAADAANANGATSATVATEGSWIAVPCKGARGCARGSASDDCDDTLAAEGDRCPRNPPLDYACTADHAKALVCKDGTFGVWRACRGADGCKVEAGRNVRCDTRLGEPGDPCGQAGTYSCSVDHASMLTCDGAVLVPASSCRGAQGCRVQADSRKVDCDDAVAVEGDACDQEGRIACALDHKAELSCVHGKYARKRDCRRSDCRLDGNELFCD